MTHFAGKAARAFLLAGLTTFVLATSSLAAQLPADEGTITGSSVRMRSGASTSTSILTVMANGTNVTVLGKANDNWYNISYKGMTGCVSADYLKLIPKEVTPAPIPDPEPTPTPQPAADLPAGVGTITGSGVRMRAGASTSTAIRTTMDKNTVVAILGKTGSWYNISCGGKTGYVREDYLKKDSDGVFTAYGRVSGSGVNLRAVPGDGGDIVTILSKDAPLTISSLVNGWYSVTCTDGSAGYIRGDLVTLDSAARYDFIADSPNSSGQAVVDLAREFLGVRYVYGGSGPKTFDCSGLTRYVAKQFGVSLAHSATSQWQSGKGVKVSKGDLEPGDFVYFCDPSRSKGKACSHCGIYIGDNQFIHASSSKGKVVIGDLASTYYSKYFVGGLRLF